MDCGGQIQITRQPFNRLSFKNIYGELIVAHSDRLIGYPTNLYPIKKHLARKGLQKEIDGYAALESVPI